MPLPFEIIDAHIHLWDPRITPRTVTPAVKLLGWNPALLRWMVPRLFPRKALDFVGTVDTVLDPHLPGNYLASTGHHKMRGFVHIEANWEGGEWSAVDETRWLEQICGRDLLAIVARAHLDAPQLHDILDAHVAVSDRVVGVRDLLGAPAHPDIYGFSAPGRTPNPKWREGYAELGRRGLSFDAWMYAHQMAEFEPVVREHPQTRVVLDHLLTPAGVGGPIGRYATTDADRARIREAWERDLRALAAYSQVHAKLSGLTMPVVGWGFHRHLHPPGVTEVADTLGPFIEIALDAFGPERCFFASNFPMDKASLPFETLFDAFVQLTASLGEDVQQGLFHDNAARFYRIDEIGETSNPG